MDPTIRADDLALVLGSLKLHRYTRGRTCLLAAMSEAPMIRVDCRDRASVRAALQPMAQRTMGRAPRIGPLCRGDIGLLYERTLRTRGRAEVQRTWGAGIRALRDEPRHTLRTQRVAA